MEQRPNDCMSLFHVMLAYTFRNTKNKQTGQDSTKKKNYNRQTFPQIRVPISRLQLNLRINQRTNKLNGLHCTLINCKIEDKVQTLNIAINLGPAVVYNYRHLHAQQLKAKYL